MTNTLLHHEAKKLAPRRFLGVKKETWADESTVQQIPVEDTGNVMVLDLGCGLGSNLNEFSLPTATHIVGVDPNPSSLRLARILHPARQFMEGRGEHLPFPDHTFDLIVAKLSLPYMHIPNALREMRRTLKPGGQVVASFHPVGFTLRELIKIFPLPIPTLYRLYVLANGVLFHFAGKLMPFGRRVESFQTERALRRAFAAAGLQGQFESRENGKFRVWGIPALSAPQSCYPAVQGQVRSLAQLACLYQTSTSSAKVGVTPRLH